MRNLVIAGLSVLLVCMPGIAGDESFEKTKKKLASAGCVSVEFLAVIESEIFESVDSADGRAEIASDGRYRIRLGEDMYLATGEQLYTYSAANNQVTVEALRPGAVNTEITLLQSLDESYKTAILRPDSVYALTRDSTAESGLPDSLMVYLTAGGGQIDRMEYLDINGELNRLILKTLSTAEQCDSAAFVPSFPDSVEIIELF